MWQYGYINEGTTFSNILLHLEAPPFSFILGCDMTLLVFQDIACISSQNLLKRLACLAKRSQTKLLSNQGFTVISQAAELLLEKK